jgi:hypothetical protein
MFSFFRKKKKKVREVPKVESILCIPGKWKDKTELLLAIVEANSGDYLMAGIVLMHIKTKTAFRILVEPRKDVMKSTFQYSGLINDVSEQFLEDIDAHEQVVYLLAETGSYETAKAFALAGNAILKAGGIGIHVESAGKAFEKEAWNEMLENYKEHYLYTMFVHDSIKDEGGNLFSCGMHHLGLKDAIVCGENTEVLHETLNIWGTYQVIDKPEIKLGETFSVAVEAPVFRITEAINPPYKDHEVLKNPFGMWQLNQIKP